MAQRAVLIKTGQRPINTARPVDTAHLKTTVYNARPMSCFSKSAQSTGHPQKEDQDYVDSGCSRHMIGNMSYLSDFKEFNGGYVSFREGSKGGRITSKEALKTGKLDFEDVYFIKDLKFNLFSVLQILMHKTYGLVIIDDYSKYTWVFILATKNETTCILKKFITEIENLVDKKVKVEAVNTACYVQNKVLVVKPHIKTPYELFRGRTPTLSFMRPFRFHVTILNTLDHLGKFDGKADEGYFVGYSMNSKAFRVYNIRTKRVEENLNVRFLEDKPIIAGAGPKWLFDIDILTKSMKYVPVIASTNSDDFTCIKDSIGAGQSNMETRSNQDYIFMTLWKDGSPLFDSSPKICSDAKKKHDEVSDKECGASNKLNSAFESLNTKYPDDPKMPGLETIATNDDIEEEADFTNLESSIDVSPTPKQESSTQARKNHEDLNTCLFACFLSQIETTRVPKALTDPAWVEAMQEELLQFKLQKMDVKSAFLYERIEEK
nr:ribonuclease H-like domain-containing protein [Tanacetum cinerariifolium]